MFFAESMLILILCSDTSISCVSVVPDIETGYDASLMLFWFYCYHVMLLSVCSRERVHYYEMDLLHPIVNLVPMLT